MPSGTIRLEGLAGLKSSLSSISARIEKAKESTIVKETRATRDDARSHAPRDTGDLVEHIDDEVTGTNGRVKSTSRHAGFVEHGTFKDEAQPYMTPAAERTRRRAPKTLEVEIRQAVGGR